MSPQTYIFWAIILIIQNFAFTFVSRARNSGSLKRHIVAALFSNGVWFISQTIIFSQMFKMMTGEYGHGKAVLTGAFYTVFTLAGSLAAHYVSLLTEKGKSAVGASKKYAQITPEDWKRVQEQSERAEKLADQAYTCAVGALPTAAVATKVGGEIVTSINK